MTLDIPDAVHGSLKLPAFPLLHRPERRANVPTIVQQPTGRPVRISCMSFPGMDLEQATALLRLEGAFSTDLVVLPEY